MLGTDSQLAIHDDDGVMRFKAGDGDPDTDARPEAGSHHSILPQAEVVQYERLGGVYVGQKVLERVCPTF